MGQTRGLVDRLRQPEYIGENRCMACTIINTIIAALLAGAVSIVGTMLTTQAIGLGLGIVVFICSVAAIYLRGYLVPKTPELTKQYFPRWLLDLFGKAPAQGAAVDSEIDPEQTLLTAGAIEECEDVDDLCLSPAFRAEWYDEIERVEAEEAGRDRLLELLGVDDGEVEFTEYGEAFQARLDGTTVGRWESKAAFYADLAAATQLEPRVSNWATLSAEDRSQLLSGLRIFIDTCPSCGGIPELQTETVESCCTTQEVAAVACQACDARLFESPV